MDLRPVLGAGRAFVDSGVQFCRVYDDFSVNKVNILCVNMRK